MRLVAKYQIESILKRTASKLFKTAKVGDTITLRYTVNGGYKSSPMIDVYINGHYIGDGYPHQIRDVMDRAFRYNEVPIRWGSNAEKEAQ